MWFVHFRRLFQALVVPWLLAVLIQSAGRLYLLLSYAPLDMYVNYRADIYRSLTTGILFDIRVASIAYAPLLLLACVLAVKTSFLVWWRRFYLSWAMVVTVIVGALTVTNVFYYRTYERAIDVFIFGLFDDDTKAILTTIWLDYPVVSGLLVFTLVSVSTYFLLNWWQIKSERSEKRRMPWPIAVLATLMVFSTVFVGARGSVGTFPLRQSDTQVSEVKLLNMLTPNGGMALQWAFTHYQSNSRFPLANDDEGVVLLSRFFDQSVNPDLAIFNARTRLNPIAREKPPHVVFALMESMGSHVLSFDQPDRDLLGKLRPHWQQDMLYQRFISEGDGTIDSLSRLLVHSPNENISQSTAQNIDFRSNMLKPYLQSGYKVVFVTSGNGGWRNLNQFLPHLGVSEFVEQNELKRLFPAAYITAWGVPDEYLFRYIEQRLDRAERQGEHLLIIALTTTFHPPYRIPNGYSAPAFSFNPQEQVRLARLAGGGSAELDKIFGTLRYVNDQLGEFIDWVKAHPLAEHTIIAVTGDHNIRGIGYPELSERVLGHSVPFYLYVPQAYLVNSYYDALTVGSHKDIWPTLYNLSLSETDYYRTGCDLLAQQSSAIWCFGYNPEVIIDVNGAYSQERFWPWLGTTAGELTLADALVMSDEQRRENLRRWTITPLLVWQLNRQVQEARSQ